MESLNKPYALGRNWLYTASARAGAFIYSLVETAKACLLEPRAYLRELFERIPFATIVEKRRQLLRMFIKNSDRTGMG